MAETPLDQAFSGMESEAGRLHFFSVLASAELFLVLTKDAGGEVIEPEVFETEDGTFVLAFDREDGLTEFIGKPAPYAAMSGRVLAEMLTGQGIGIALNPAVAPSAQLIDAAAVDWLHATLSNAPKEIGSKPREINAPSNVPEKLLTALDSKLASASGLAKFAYLVDVTYENNTSSHLLAIIDARHGAESALAQSVSEALTFTDLEAGALDVAFFDSSDELSARFAKVGLRFDLPQAKHPQPPA